MQGSSSHGFTTTCTPRPAQLLLLSPCRWETQRWGCTLPSTWVARHATPLHAPQPAAPTVHAVHDEAVRVLQWRWRSRPGPLRWCPAWRTPCPAGWRRMGGSSVSRAWHFPRIRRPTGCCQACHTLHAHRVLCKCWFWPLYLESGADHLAFSTCLPLRHPVHCLPMKTPQAHWLRTLRPRAGPASPRVALQDGIPQCTMASLWSSPMRCAGACRNFSRSPVLSQNSSSTNRTATPSRCFEWPRRLVRRQNSALTRPRG